MITLQDIFNAAWQAFIVEDRPPSLFADGGCAYLGAGGTKCAVGLVIPDGHPAQKFDGMFSGLIEEHPELFSLPDGIDPDHFQGQLHDDLCYSGGGGGWVLSRHDREVIYRDVAIRYGLTVPEGA